MRRAKPAALTAAAISALTTQAFAVPPPPYAVVDLSYSRFGLDTAEIEEAGIQPTERDRSATGFAVTIGWRFTPYLAAEGAFLELGEAKFDVAVPGDPSVSATRIRMRSSGVLLALAGTWPVHDKLSLEGRAGAFVGRTQTRISGMMAGPFGSRPFTNQLGSDSRTGLAGGISAVFSVDDTWALRAGYDYLDGAFGEDAGRISLGLRFNWP